MNIIVLVKQVPNTSEIKIDKENGTLIRQGIESIVNPDDGAAVEYALRLKDEYGAHVHALSMGPKQALGMFKELTAMGVDKCTLVSDKVFAGSDTWATSTILSSAIRQYPYDIIIAGRQAIDGDTAQVGPQVAEFLAIPQVTYVTSIDKVEDQVLYANRSTGDEILSLAVEMPCLLTVMHEEITPRLMQAGRIYGSSQLESEILGFNDLDLDINDCGLKGSPTRVKKTTTKPILPKSDLHHLPSLEAAQAIVRVLKTKI